MKAGLRLLAWALALASFAVVAQEGKNPWDEYDKLIQSRAAVGALGPDLFGDSVNLANGALSFSATDVSIPGNNALPVEVTRALAVTNRKGYVVNGSVVNDAEFGDWGLETPHLSGTFAPTWPSNRCAVTSLSAARPPTVSTGSGTGLKYYYAEDYWQGNQAKMPGGGEMLLVRSDTPKPTIGGPYYWMTASQTHFSCLPAIKNGSGEGFLAITADGTRYWFDWMAQFYEPDLEGQTQSGAKTYLPRRRNVLYATRVEDRFGNWVTYSYNNGWSAPGRLTSIASSDGRSVSIGYNAQGYVSTVSTNGRTWSYQYSAGNSLTSVTLPDSSQWLINLGQFSTAIIRYEDGTRSGETVRSCTEPGSILTPGASGTITHPSGATGTFSVEPLRHGRSNVPLLCSNLTLVNGVVTQENDDYSYYPLAYDSFSLTKKSISGPGLTPAEWTYTYNPTISYFLHPSGNGYPVCGSGVDCSPPQCTQDSCAGTEVTEVRGPDGKYTRYVFGNSYRYNEGKLLRVEEGSSPASIARTTATTFNLAQSGQPFPTPMGHSPQPRGDGFTSEFVRPQSASVVTQDGRTFNSVVQSFDGFARPLQTTKFSSSFSKTEVTAYHDQLDKWVLGQIASLTVLDTEPDTVVSRTEFNANASPWRTYGAGTAGLPGKLKHELAYNADGTLASVKDGRGNVTTLAGWTRGVPTSITHPATPEAPSGATESATVDGNGWITSVTDENGFVTGYGYDAMGRQASVVYPTGDSVAWNNVISSFQRIAYADRGLPAGHWRHTRQQGNRLTYSYYDGLWRPVMTLDLDGSDATWETQAQTIKRYDADSRVVFQSYPTKHVGDFNQPLLGVRTAYDALGRPTQSIADSEHGALTTTTEYLAGFQTRVTNPRGQQTVTTTYQAYDEPSYDLPGGINHPEGAYTEIYRDVFGKPTALRRRNATASEDVWRRYVYDSYQQLCKTIEPETGATVMDYDATGNLAWSAAGLSLPDTASCNRDIAYNSGRRTDRTYDARNRITGLFFPDGRGSQAWGYERDGKLSDMVVNNAPGDERVISRYTYNQRRMLTGESIEQPGWYTWSSGYGYDRNGALSVQTFPPTGLTVDYAPNALGQATRAGSYATNVSYYPNGAIRQFTYGNGIVHTMTQNARQLPDRTSDLGGPNTPLDYQYSYDQAGNVSYVGDLALGSSYSRWMSYDGLDRLTAVGSAMFGGDHWHRFTYDTLDNLKTWKLAGVKDHNYYYDPGQNRLTNVNTSTGAGIVGLSYDAQGNLSNRNGVNHSFDYGNRLREVSGKEVYRYDGHGRRVLAWSPAGGSIISQYTQSGQLAFQQNQRKNTNIDHIYLAGSLVATREHNYGTGVWATRYQHTDALGSPVAVTNESAQVIERTQWEPFGAPINRSIEGVGYTGHVMDAQTGLTYMQQRYYDPGVGRFLSVDPVTANSNTGANFNRYWYANNNPYKFIDPDGRLGCTGSHIKSVCDGGGVAALRTSARSPLDTGAARGGSATTSARASGGASPQSQGNAAIRFNAAPPRTVPPSGENAKALQCTANCVGADELLVTGGAEQSGHSRNSSHYDDKAVDIVGPPFNNVQHREIMDCAKACGYTHGGWEVKGRFFPNGDAKSSIYKDHWHFQIGERGRVPPLP